MWKLWNAVLVAACLAASPAVGAPVYIELADTGGQYHVIWYDRAMPAVDAGEWSIEWLHDKGQGNYEFIRLAGYACGSGSKYAQVEAADTRQLVVGKRDYREFTRITVGELKVEATTMIGGWQTGDMVAVISPQESMPAPVYVVGRYFESPCENLLAFNL